MTRYIGLCLFLILSFNRSQAQELQVMPVVGLQFNGLKKTKASHLNNYLRTKDLSTINADDIAQYAKKLRMLNSILDVSYSIDTIKAGQVLQFDIEEAATLFPIINFGGIKENLWFQLGITDINWLGRGIQLTAFYQNTDNRSNYNIFYRVPYISGSKWGFSLNATRFASVEPLYFDEEPVFYRYTNNSYAASLLYEFQIGHSLELGFNYFIEQYEKDEEQLLQQTPGPDNARLPKWLGKIGHRLSDVEYSFYHRDGFDNTLLLQSVYNTTDGSWFFIMLDNFVYHKTYSPKSELGLRLRLGLSSNDNTPFAPFVLDSNLNIRGSGNRIDRGTAQLVLNLEYRYSIWDKQQLPLAVQAVVFSDIGTWRNPGGRLGDLWRRENFRHFAGLGFRLIYKKAYNAIFRVDYGVDIYNIEERGFVVGIGQFI